MKIAIFSDCYLDLTGGIVSSINAQKTALEARGHTVYIFSTGYLRTTEERQKIAKKHIFMVPSCRWLIRGVTPVARRPKIIEKWLMREHPELKDFDIFYVHYEGGCSIAGLRLAKELGVPSVQVMHGREDAGEEKIIPFGLRTIVARLLDWFHSWYLPHPVKIGRDDYLAKTAARAQMWELMVNHANFADVVISPSRHFAKKLRHYGVKKQIQVCPNGYPDEYFPAKVAVRELKPGETLKIIWHSRLFGEKRVLPFLKALKMVQGRYQLDVYGDGADLERAKRLAKKYRLPVNFHGAVKFEVVRKAMLGAHLDALASYDFDDYPMTLVEAEACGLPVFICDPDLREIVPTGGYILSVPETPEAMAAALSDLIAHPERIEKISKAMIEHRSEVLISQRIKKIETLFRRLVKTE